MNWLNEKRRSENQAKIVEAIYGNYLEFMTFRELLDETKLTRQTLAHHLRELCQESKREKALYNELGRITPIHPNLEVPESLPIRRLLRTPILVSKHGVYKLHPATKWALDKRIYPHVVRGKDEALRFMKKRQASRPKKEYSALPGEAVK